MQACGTLHPLHHLVPRVGRAPCCVVDPCRGCDGTAGWRPLNSGPRLLGIAAAPSMHTGHMQCTAGSVQPQHSPTRSPSPHPRQAARRAGCAPSSHPATAMRQGIEIRETHACVPCKLSRSLSAGEECTCSRMCCRCAPPVCRCTLEWHTGHEGVIQSCRCHAWCEAASAVPSRP